MRLRVGSRCVSYLLAASFAALSARNVFATTYFVRQTVGSDDNDGLSPRTAWKHLTKLWFLHAGDTAYVGPGLYRDEIEVKYDGSADARITFIADTDGRHTGDPPGLVMITGAEPVDESIFSQASSPAVFAAPVLFNVLGVVEMDSSQFRYQQARNTKEHLVDKLTELQVVEKLPSTFYYDEKARTLYVHTSNGRSPQSHEIELFRRGNGVMLNGKHYVTVIGFTFRHMGDAGIGFYSGSGEGAALFNTSYGSRQGIRVFAAPNMLIYGNTLFRNENSGVYFAAGSTNGSAIRNITFENVKGIRWGSKSGNAVALENVAFDNSQAGISIEDVKPATVWFNRLGNNRAAQLLVLDAGYVSDKNCFEVGGPEQFLADFFPYPRDQRFRKLREYQDARQEDLGSRETGCGPWPEKPDVHKMHADTTAYRERALKALESPGEASPKPTATPTLPPRSPVASRNTAVTRRVAYRRIRSEAQNDQLPAR